MPTGIGEEMQQLQHEHLSHLPAVMTWDHATIMSSVHVEKAAGVAGSSLMIRLRKQGRAKNEEVGGT